MTWAVEGPADWRMALLFSGITADEAEALFDTLSDVACDCEGDPGRHCRNVFGALRNLPADSPEPLVEVSYDPHADASYVDLDDGRVIHHTEDLGNGVLVDVDADGYVVGIELLGRLRPSLGVALAGETRRAHSEAPLEPSG